ncbi:flavin reductase family protein [Rahnella perminowiae]|uniref:flavin reductase family protein n=1 Tax=Rahnella perminowiae TaxID=2816244 RepID=UPI0036638117
MTPQFAPVELEKANRLINHGATALVSAHHEGVDNVMSASWVCGLDFKPAKLMVVIDKIARTRELIEESGYFVIQVPTVAQLQMTYDLGNRTLRTDPDKLQHCGTRLFRMEDHGDLPFVAGCTAWLACRVIPEPHNQQAHDLFIGEIVGAWADTRVFKDGHWHFEDAGSSLRSLHYIAGGQFYATGEPLNAKTDLK